MSASSNKWIEQNIDTGRFKEKFLNRAKRVNDVIDLGLFKCERSCICNNCENDKMEQADLAISGGFPRKY